MAWPRLGFISPISPGTMLLPQKVIPPTTSRKNKKISPLRIVLTRIFERAFKLIAFFFDCLANSAVPDEFAVELDVDSPLDIIRFYFPHAGQAAYRVFDGFFAPRAMHAFDFQMSGFIHHRILLAEPRPFVTETPPVHGCLNQVARSSHRVSKLGNKV